MIEKSISVVAVLGSTNFKSGLNICRTENQSLVNHLKLQKCGFLCRIGPCTEECGFLASSLLESNKISVNFINIRFGKQSM